MKLIHKRIANMMDQIARSDDVFTLVQWEVACRAALKMIEYRYDRIQEGILNDNKTM